MVFQFIFSKRPFTRLNGKLLENKSNFNFNHNLSGNIKKNKMKKLEAETGSLHLALHEMVNPVSTEVDLKNTFVSILDGHEEFVLSLEGNILGSNLEAVNLTGYEEWEVIGKHFTLLYLPEEIESNTHLEHLRKCETEGTFSSESWKLKKRGVRFFAKIRFMNKLNNLRQLVGYRMVVSDITHKVVYDNKLSKIREKYLSIYNNAFVGIITISCEDFHVIHCNTKAKEILPNNAANLKASFEENSQFEIFKNKLFKEHVVLGFEFKTKTVTGNEKWISIDCKLDADEHTLEGVIIDITKHKINELEVAKLTTEVNSFIYHASHELRAPFSTTLGILNLLEMERKKDIVVANYVSMIRGRIKIQDELLKDLTAVIYNNTAPPCYELFLFEKELPLLIDEFETQYHKVKVKFLIETNQVYTDSIRLRTVLRNIFSNAYKYLQNIKPLINVHVLTNGEKLEIKIRDNGIGMTDDQLITIFNLFNRAHNGYPGNGVGLYLVKSILDSLKGDIKIHSKPSVGTEVRISIPTNRMTMAVL
jgi:PAS domain S-box-containing protein